MTSGNVEEILQAGALEIRLTEGLVSVPGGVLMLSVREFHLLVALARRTGGILRREELYRTVWGSELRVFSRSLHKILTTRRTGRWRLRSARGSSSARAARAPVRRLGGRSRHGHDKQGVNVNPRNLVALSATVLLSAALAACGSSSSKSSTTPSGSSSATITGAGSTFAAPVYSQWGSQGASGVSVNYQAVGSGAGLTALETKTANFGASDPPLKPADEAAILKNGSPAVQIPMFLGAITASYNVAGVKTGLKLDGKTLGDIFLGKVKSWNDNEIKALNPGVVLPGTPITTIHRSDSSGTTAGFTGFLAAVDPEFKTKVGSGKDVNWPGGTGAKGNAGVAGAVAQTSGSIGYVEQAYALQHNFTYASIKNKAGVFVAPSLASATAAGLGVTVPANLGISISDPSGAGSYPITSATFIVVNQDLCKAGLSATAAKAVATFINYGLNAGQAVLSAAQYAALPAAILAKDKAAAAGLQCNGAAVGAP